MPSCCSIKPRRSALLHRPLPSKSLSGHPAVHVLKYPCRCPRVDYRLLEMQQRFQALRSQTSLAAMTATLDREWQQLQSFRTALHTRSRPSPLSTSKQRAPVPSAPLTPSDSQQTQQAARDTLEASQQPQCLAAAGSQPALLAVKAGPPAGTPPTHAKQATDAVGLQLTPGLTPVSASQGLLATRQQPSEHTAAPASILKYSAARQSSARRVSFGEQLEIGPSTKYNAPRECPI